MIEYIYLIGDKNGMIGYTDSKNMLDDYKYHHPEILSQKIPLDEFNKLMSTQNQNVYNELVYTTGQHLMFENDEAIMYDYIYYNYTNEVLESHIMKLISMIDFIKISNDKKDTVIASLSYILKHVREDHPLSIDFRDSSQKFIDIEKLEDLFHQGEI